MADTETLYSPGRGFLGVETRTLVLESEFPPVVQLSGTHYITISKVIGKARAKQQKMVQDPLFVSFSSPFRMSQLSRMS